MRTIALILTEAGILPPGFHFHIENPPWMPLDIEDIETRGPFGFRSVSVAHYGRQNGDAMRDPEMLFEMELRDGVYRLAELEATLEGSPTAHSRAERARKHAHETHEAAHGEASKVPDFRPSTDLKSLFREVAKRLHPDFAKNEADEQRRTRFMAEANEAYGRGDSEALRRILDEFRDSSDLVPGEGIGAELIRIIRQIATARQHIATIERELEALHAGELGKLWQDFQSAEKQGRDLLAELANKVGEQVVRARREYEALAHEAKQRGR